MKKLILGVSVSVFMGAVTAYADTLEGGKILELEAEKARQIKDLEYQAKLIEQKAKLARAYKELSENGGFVPGAEGNVVQGVQPSNKSGVATDIFEKDEFKDIPTLKSISGGTALFEIGGRLFRVNAGSQLPGGFEVLSVNHDQGVRLKLAENIYRLDVTWTQATK